MSRYDFLAPQIIAAYQSGKGTLQIQNELMVPRSSAWLVLKRAGIQTYPRGTKGWICHCGKPTEGGRKYCTLHHKWAKRLTSAKTSRRYQQQRHQMLRFFAKLMICGWCPQFEPLPSGSRFCKRGHDKHDAKIGFVNRVHGVRYLGCRKCRQGRKRA